MNHYLKIVYMILATLFLASCESDYSKKIKSELESGDSYENLFLDLNVGDTKKDFYDKCWLWNKKGLVSQGPGNQYAKYNLDLSEGKDSLGNVELLFYGIFDDNDVMYGMDMKMSYKAWSLWNEKYHATSLVNDLQEYYIKLYGKNKFIPITIEKEVTAYAKIDGNRQILIYPINKKDVAVKITDTKKQYDIK